MAKEFEHKFKKKLTWEDIEFHCEQIGKFFKQIPDDLKAGAAEYFIYEIVNWGSHDHFQALGIFTEAMLRYRNVSYELLNEEKDEENEEEIEGEEWKREEKTTRIQEQLTALEKSLFNKCPKCESEDIEFHNSKWNCNNCKFEWESGL